MKGLPAEPTIADVATGTGLFAIEVAKQLPKAEVHGLDISSKLFHEQSKLPKNVRLGTYDIHNAPSLEHQSKFDLIHVRLIVSGMQKDDWAPAVDHLLSMLKPGGWIQWEEADYPNADFQRGNPGSKTEAVDKFAFAWRDASLEKFRHGYNTLPGIMRDAGMVDVSPDIVASDRLAETRRRTTANSLEIAGIGNRVIADRGLPGAMSHETIGTLEKAAWAELDLGVYVRYQIHVNMGRKP